jgi:chromosomal replication initiation ATPase DnaA
MVAVLLGRHRIIIRKCSKVMYLTKKDQETIQAIERCVHRHTGIDRDVYMYTTRWPLNVKCARFAYIYEMYSRTNLTVVDIAEKMKRNHTSIIRAINRVRRILHNGATTKESLIYRKIHADIDTEILGRRED